MFGTLRQRLRTSWRTPAVACVLAALGFVLGPSAGAGPIPPPKPDKRDSSKKEEPRKDDKQPAAVPEPAGFDVQHAARLQEEVQRHMQEMEKRMRAIGPAGFRPGGSREEGRLGVTVEKPSATLVDQLDLPRGQGLVLEEVPAESAAAKSGMKAHDILLEVNGKAVPDDARELARQLEGVKPDTPVNAVVLRKGKRETIKGLKLPETAAAGVGNFPMPAPPGPLLPRVMAIAGHDLAAGGGATVSVLHNGDQFTARYQDGTLAIRVTGTTAGGKAKAGEITVTDDGKTEKYESIDKVPERYRDKVKSLVESSARTGVRIDVKGP